MKTHIIFAAFSVLILSACASLEGRKISSVEEDHSTPIENSRHEANSGREVSRR